MNIIKLKDVLMPSEYKCNCHDDNDDSVCSIYEMSEFFNQKLKGKYAYWIKTRYIFSMEDIDYEKYVIYEQSDDIDHIDDIDLAHQLICENNTNTNDKILYIDTYDEDCCMIDFINEYVDLEITEAINSPLRYEMLNLRATDAEIDMSKIKKFRTWLAEKILNINMCEGIEDPELVYTYLLNDNEQHMLNYYKNNMYNKVTKYLSIFGDDTASLNISNKNSKSNCGFCSDINNIANMYSLSNIQHCNALNIYTKNIKKFMVNTFENIDFWIRLDSYDDEFLKLFKLYIDNIIKSGLIINNVENANTSLYNVCKCNDSTNNTNTIILQNLSVSLQYIIDKDIVSHKNFIHDSFYNWAEHLYEYMQWT